ncbi:MAG: helix-turn-helix transcriptional regulator [Lysobacter sp.]|nr:helix-turn-helix transcriptional regulator [Lysobacter sp.]
MTDTTPSGAVATLVALDGSRSTSSLSPADAASLGATHVVSPPSGDLPGAGGGGSAVPPSSVPPSDPPDDGPDSNGPAIMLEYSEPLEGATSDASASPSGPPKKPAKGSVFLRAEVLRFLREQKLLSQQDMADDCDRRHIRLSIATIKRTELGHAVRYRTVHEFARYFGMPVDLLLR